MANWVSFSETLRDKYLDHLESEKDVTTAAEYFDYVDGYSNAQNPDKFREKLKQSDFELRHLFQMTPVVDQDVVILSTNPALPKGMTVDIFNDDRVFGRRMRYGDDMEAYGESIAKHQGDYLSNSQGFSTIIEELQNGLSLMTSTDEVPLEEYVRPDEVAPGNQNLFSEAHYTRVFKFPSGDKDPLLETEDDDEVSDIDFGREMLFYELNELLSPKLIVVTGKIAWNTIYDEDDGGWVSESDIVPHRDSHLTHKFGPHDPENGPSDKPQACGGLFKIPKSDLWIITTHHGSNPLYDDDRLHANIEYVNERI